MAPVLHCVRHAQGYHNEGPGYYHLEDPDLTPKGKQQCEVLLQTTFTDQSGISLVVASPLMRALHTAHLVFQPALASGGKCAPQIIALSDAQETSDDPCDKGSDIPTLQNTIAHNGWLVDLSLVKSDWTDKSLVSRYSGSLNAIRTRARGVRIFLHRKVQELVQAGDFDAQVVLVAHGSFLHFFTEDWEDADWSNGTGWSNCETRSYVFEDDDLSDTAGGISLVETNESRQRRGKTHAAYGREKQSELFQTAMQVWGSSGLQRPDKVGVGKVNL